MTIGLPMAGHRGSRGLRCGGHQLQSRKREPIHAAGRGLGGPQKQLDPNEAIVAGTWNAACVLGTQGRRHRHDCPGQPADFQLLDGEQEGCVSWELGSAGLDWS